MRILLILHFDTLNSDKCKITLIKFSFQFLFMKANVTVNDNNILLSINGFNYENCLLCLSFWKEWLLNLFSVELY